MSIIYNTVGYMDEDAVLEGFFAYDDAITGTRPVVLIQHAWVGRDEFVEEIAKKLASLGYLGFAADVYGKGVRGNTPEQCAGLMQPFMQDRARLQKRLLAGLAAVKLLPWADSQRIAAIGFCFGGLCVLDLARTGADIRGVVSYHGLLTAPANIPAPEIKAKTLVLHGHDDPMVPPAQVLAFQTEFSKANADWQVHTYSQTMHAFMNPQANDPAFGTVYQARTEQRAWQAMQNFLTEIM